MERLIWAAARRLALLVGCALVVDGALLVRDASLHRGAPLADVLAALAVCLAVLALVAILRARLFFTRAEETTLSPSDPYRHNTRVQDNDGLEAERAHATRRAAGALIALAISAAFAVVAAASR